MNLLQTAPSSMRLVTQPGFQGIGVEANELADLDEWQADVSEICDVVATALEELAHVEGGPEPVGCIGRRWIDLNSVVHACPQNVNQMGDWTRFALYARPISCCMTGHDNLFERGWNYLATEQTPRFQSQEKKPKQRQARSRLIPTLNNQPSPINFFFRVHAGVVRRLAPIPRDGGHLILKTEPCCNGCDATARLSKLKACLSELTGLFQRNNLRKSA